MSYLILVTIFYFVPLLAGPMTCTAVRYVMRSAKIEVQSGLFDSASSLLGFRYGQYF